MVETLFLNTLFLHSKISENVEYKTSVEIKKCSRQGYCTVDTEEEDDKSVAGQCKKPNA